MLICTALKQGKLSSLLLLVHLSLLAVWRKLQCISGEFSPLQDGKVEIGLPHILENESANTGLAVEQ